MAERAALRVRGFGAAPSGFVASRPEPPERLGEDIGWVEESEVVAIVAPHDDSAEERPLSQPQSSAQPTPSAGGRGLRVLMQPSAAWGVVLVALAGVALGASYLWRSAPSVQSAPVARLPAASRSVAAAHGATLVVQVTGRVLRPGVVSLRSGARVLDAIRAAGGFAALADPAGINLARPVVDGEQLVVPLIGQSVAPASSGGPGPGTSPRPGGVLDLNAATAEQLDGLPGVGPVLAQRIVAWRTAHGRFSSIDELHEVGGIGAKKYEDIAPRVRV